MDQAILRRVHDNFAGSVETLCRYCDGIVAKEAGLVLFASASPSPFPWNGAVRISGDMPAAEIIERANEFFGRLGHEFSIGALEGLDDDLIAALGPADDTSPEMVMDRPPERMELAPGVEIEIVSDDEHRIDWLEVVSEAFEALGETRETWHLCYPDLTSVYNPKTVAMVLYEDGRPAAGGMYYRSGSVIEVLHIGTADEFRRRGHGRAVTTALTIHGFNNGSTLASLQAEPMGFGTYQQIGYEVLSTYHWYINPGD